MNVHPTTPPDHRDPLPSTRSIHGLPKEELTELCRAAGHPEYRASQVWNWLYVHGVDTWDAMRNTPRPFRQWLAAQFHLDAAVPLRTAAGDGGDGTRKLLLRLHDGECIESVLIPSGCDEAPARPDRPRGKQGTASRPRRTVCVSTQVGCKYHCAFCASGQGGFVRHLETGEIVAQVTAARRAFEERPTHVVFMGIGEPLDNYDAVLEAIRILNDPDGLGIGARRITISTSGLIPGIRRLAGEGLQVELSVSLHAAEDEARSRLMPINRQYPLSELIDACRDYARETGRIITFEYTLIHGVNDAPADARRLAALLDPVPCRINLLLLSPVEEFDGRPPTVAAAHRFLQSLTRSGPNATLREPRGCALRAACGQLRHSHREGGP